jgi:mannose-6-phosphate isomerase-like protein (cupin superfamily)
MSIKENKPTEIQPVSAAKAPSKPTYSPSPRPTFAGPAAISYADVTRHIWGDEEAGEVFDWIYASTDNIHMLVFGLAPGGEFRHSHEFRTVFGADEILHVLSGTMILANPETGEVLRVPAGENAFFRADTWHHVFAHGDEPLRVLEFLSPPPSAGTTGAYARSKEYLAESRYTDDSLLGRIPDGIAAHKTLTWIRPEDVVYRLEGGALVGVLGSTEHLTVASLSLPVSKSAPVHSHGGDEIVFVRSGTLSVRAWHNDQTSVFELEPNDAAYIPQGALHEYRNYGPQTVEAVFGVAPSYLPEAPDLLS